MGLVKELVVAPEQPAIGLHTHILPPARATEVVEDIVIADIVVTAPEEAAMAGAVPVLPVAAAAVAAAVRAQGGFDRTLEVYAENSGDGWGGLYRVEYSASFG